MTKATPELAPPSPTFRATPTGGRLAATYDLACNRQHTRRIFSGIRFRTCGPPVPRSRLNTRPPRPWSKWKKQYIMDLLNAHALKNPNPQQNIKIHDVVLLEGDNKSKLLWRLGRVIQVFPDRDGGIRSCLLKTSDETLKRPVQLLYPLEL
ncbi:hypothetical protein AVEN_215372-1 [Araneus ventricosus]|uniref:DUF5641 domain-containing protein n=1 Tax=Araneus ventricosus TaxID=182803 RepID=A0A4Y2KUJ2_ARAVE|nr:hypothetical protein AVEN_215372-1 [Araneus ventricosus]